MKMHPRKRRRCLALESMEPRNLLATLFVTTGADDGAGSLRAALAAANGSVQSNTIVIRNSVTTIALESSLTYTGSARLSILGGNATIRPIAGSEGDFDLLVSTGGANLNLSRLTLRDGANGIYAPIPSGKTGVVAVDLDKVNLLDNGGFGLWVDDQLGQGGAGGDSAASIDLLMRNATVAGNGFSGPDLDGVRVDEGGTGSIYAKLERVTISDNGGDGLELDERGAGDVTLNVTRSSFDGNGEFDPNDLDDGIDIDEAGAGTIRVRLSQVSIDGNFDEGLDLTEADDGDIVALLTGVTANGNTDDGIKLEELGAGNILFSFLKVTANNTITEEGISISENDDGNLRGLLTSVTANGNGKDGIDLAEAGTGSVELSLVKVEASDNAEDGVTVAEAGAGDLGMVAIQLRAKDNVGDGLSVVQDPVAVDEGLLLLLRDLLTGNGLNLATAGVEVTDR